MKEDKWMRLTLFWIALMLTIIAFRPISRQVGTAQAENKEATEPVPTYVKFKEPIRVELREPIEVKITDIRSTWPYEIRIKDEVKVTGELKLKD